MQFKRPGRRLIGLSLLLVVSILLVACGSEPVQPAATPTEEATQAAPAATAPPIVAAPSDTPEQATATPVAAPTETARATDAAPPPTDTIAPPTATAEPTPALVSAFGLTEDGLYFRGNPTAAVTVVDYSDFL